MVVLSLLLVPVTRIKSKKWHCRLIVQPVSRSVAMGQLPFGECKIEKNEPLSLYRQKIIFYILTHLYFSTSTNKPKTLNKEIYNDLHESC